MSNLKELAEISGVASEYTDKVGQVHYTTDAVRKCFLKDMGYHCETETEIDNSLKYLQEAVWRRGTDFVHAFFTDEPEMSVNLYIPRTDKNGTAVFEFEDEKKYIIRDEVILTELDIQESKIIDDVDYIKIEVPILKRLNEGYYNLSIYINNKKYKTMLIMALPKCYLEEGVAEEQFRVYGIAAQLYALRSKNNMGIGDFTDLKKLIKLVAANGGDVVGVNPLGAMFPESRADVSPYRALSRAYLNYVYVDLKAVPEYNESAIVQAMINSENIKSQVEYLRNLDKVYYYGVFKLKIQLLKAMFEYFKAVHINKQKGITTRGQEFLNFVEAKGERFNNLCAFEALLEKYSGDGTYNDWRFWPYCYDDINSINTREFAEKNYDLLNFYAYCHWLADCQLKEAADLCKQLNMKIGLYLDSPIGASSSGVEVWENREVFAENMGIGAPADPMRPRGQSWGFAPYHPQKLRINGYAPFIHLIRENMQHAKALRIDHAMGLMRLFWIFFEQNNPVVQGAYVYYNMKELVAILSIESHRHKCMVIGEDLGTVPPGFREYMFEHGLLSNKVFFRQKNKDGSFLEPDKYQYLSLAQACTHDQATICGYWLDEDIETFNGCRLYVNEEQYQKNLETRKQERQLLIDAFEKQQTFYDAASKQDAINKLDGKSLPKNLEYAVNKYVAKTNSAIYLQRIEDIYGQIVMENVPGTTFEYPNWRVKLGISLEDIERDGRLAEVFKIIAKERS